MTENKLVKRIEIVLIPLLGAIMSAATVKVQCAKLKIKPEELSIPDLPLLAQGVERALIIFIGSNKAAAVAASIKNIV